MTQKGNIPSSPLNFIKLDLQLSMLIQIDHSRFEIRILNSWIFMSSISFGTSK